MFKKSLKNYSITLVAISLAVSSLLIPLSSLSQIVAAQFGSTAKEGNGQKSISVKDYDAMKNCATDTSKRPTSIEYLTYFNCGRVSESQNGQTVREFTLIVKENQTVEVMDGGYNLHAWTFNDTVPGPTMRMTEGDLVKITVVNDASNRHSHSIHMHSIHPGVMDGVEGAGIVAPGKNFTYVFTAQPYGVYPYHCHVSPVADHINRGLYGMMIIDPKEPRPQMKEMAMLMNGYDFNYDDEGPVFIPSKDEVNSGEIPDSQERDNELYSVNGKAFDYVNHPIQLVAGEKYRIYLVNLLEFDRQNSMHIHGSMFEWYPEGTSMNPAYLTDIVTLGQGDRGIMELSYPYPGRYMFHAHINEFADKGWMGFFNVVSNNGTSSIGRIDNVTSSSNSSGMLMDHGSMDSTEQ
jgi:FtsP/CotA-like multicopper oxidase with cupredoxin domain